MLLCGGVEEGHRYLTLTKVLNLGWGQERPPGGGDIQMNLEETKEWKEEVEEQSTKDLIEVTITLGKLGLKQVPSTGWAQPPRSSYLLIWKILPVI